MDGLNETLENLREDLRDNKPTTSEEVVLSPTLRTILARQSLMLPAMFNLTGMVEDLLVASGKPRRTVFDDLRVAAPEGTAPLPGGPPGGQLQIPSPATTVRPPVREAPPARVHHRPGDRAGFGALGRRRRRAGASVLAVLIAGLCLVFLLPFLGAGGGAETAGSVAPEKAPAGAPEGAGRDPDPEGTPTDSALPPQREAAADGQVRATASEPATTSIPDVSGRGVEAAARAVSEAGFRVTTVRVEVSRAEAGTVTGTEPAAGTDARSGAPVVLVASGGPDNASGAAASASSSGTSAPASASASASPTP